MFNVEPDRKENEVFGVSQQTQKVTKNKQIHRRFTFNSYILSLLLPILSDNTGVPI